MRVVGVIPARLAATRLPNKPLLDIHGKPMIQHVWERALSAGCLDDLIVATPDSAIAQAVIAFGGRAEMTSSAHRSGTDRVAEIARAEMADVYVNIQGDEPLIDADNIARAVEPFSAEPQIEMTSLMCRCPEEDLENPACVKVVCTLSGDALYFSRARIPFQRQPESAAAVMQHIGLYAYRRDLLLKLSSLSPTPLELTESLEQLRAIEHGVRIRLVEVNRAPLSVDTPDDLERVEKLMHGSVP